MMAILISLVLRIPIDTIKEGLNDFVGVERRFEFIYEKDFKIVDDHFANGGNIDVTFETMKHMKYNDLYLVYAIRGSRGVTVNRENAEAIVKWSKILRFSKIIATTSSSLMTVKDIVTEDEKNVLYEVLEKNGIEIDFYEELEDAIEKSLSLVKDDDVILLGGCQGMDHGARIMLNKIHDMNPDIDEEELFKPLEKRVAGII
jgi:UDP-N-acetylmuramoyl-L-alanyl-D-glutamate--2,6-diaminopimelate ligase